MIKKAATLLIFLLLLPVSLVDAQPPTVPITFCNCEHSYFIYMDRIVSNETRRNIRINETIRVMGFCYQGYGINAYFDYNGVKYPGNDVEITIQEEGTIFFYAMDTCEDPPALFDPGDIGVLAAIIIIFVISFLIIDANR